ncbi:MAG: hypothetical protein RIR97_279 [Pseudomonadota bacterium]
MSSKRRVIERMNICIIKIVIHIECPPVFSTERAIRMNRWNIVALSANRFGIQPGVFTVMSISGILLFSRHRNGDFAVVLVKIIGLFKLAAGRAAGPPKGQSRRHQLAHRA